MNDNKNINKRIAEFKDCHPKKNIEPLIKLKKYSIIDKIRFR